MLRDLLSIFARTSALGPLEMLTRFFFVSLLPARCASRGCFRLTMASVEIVDLLYRGYDLVLSPCLTDFPD